MAGEVDVEAMLRRLTPQQFLMWKQYARLEPFGAERDNWHAGVVASTIAKAGKLVRQKDGQALSPDDFMHKIPEEETPPVPKAPQTWQESKEIMHNIYLMSQQMETV